jgi:hypothetical protein
LLLCFLPLFLATKTKPQTTRLLNYETMKKLAFTGFVQATIQSFRATIQRMRNRSERVYASNAPTRGPTELAPGVAATSPLAAGPLAPMSQVLHLSVSTPRSQTANTTASSFSEAEAALYERRRMRLRHRNAKAAKTQQIKGICTRFPTVYVDVQKLEALLQERFAGHECIVNVSLSQLNGTSKLLLTIYLVDSRKPL